MEKLRELLFTKKDENEVKEKKYDQKGRIKAKVNSFDRTAC